MQFEYYVLNYDCHKKEVERWNIFRNISLQEETEKEVKKYLRAPSKYKYEDIRSHEVTYGFGAFCIELEHLIAWQERGRREYEISVGDAFEDDVTKLEKWDCYMQCKPNIPMIAREVIWQYKQQKKESSNGE